MQSAPADAGLQLRRAVRELSVGLLDDGADRHLHKKHGKGLGLRSGSGLGS